VHRGVTRNLLSQRNLHRENTAHASLTGVNNTNLSVGCFLCWGYRLAGRACKVASWETGNVSHAHNMCFSGTRISPSTFHSGPGWQVSGQLHLNKNYIEQSTGGSHL
jgi:hypothetical protein